MRPDLRLSRAERRADVYGVVIGAASTLGALAETRLAAAERRARRQAVAFASDRSDAAKVDVRFTVAVEVGRHAALAGRVDREDAARALAALERKLAPDASLPARAEDDMGLAD